MSLDDICREAASQTALALGKSLREGVDAAIREERSRNAR